MLRGERQPLSDQETHDNPQAPDLGPCRRSGRADLERCVRLRHPDRRPGGARDPRVRLNSQLLESRFYDERLDNELASIYARLQHPRWLDQWLGSRYTRAARQVHSLFIEFNEVTDRTENALKFIGDIYAARLFWLVAERLGLSTWKADIETKLKTLDDIYRFAVEQGAMSRGQFLELTIVLILVLELVLFFMGIMT